MLLLLGCGGEPAPDPYAALRDTLGLPADVPIHRITLGGRGGREHVVPVRLRVEPGDIVQFVTADRRPHSVSFLHDSLSTPGRSFLEGTSQLVSPPLLERGTRFVVTFQGAPEGDYPFRSQGAGEAVQGLIEVRAPVDPD